MNKEIEIIKESSTIIPMEKDAGCRLEETIIICTGMFTWKSKVDHNVFLNINIKPLFDQNSGLINFCPNGWYRNSSKNKNGISKEYGWLQIHTTQYSLNTNKKIISIKFDNHYTNLELKLQIGLSIKIKNKGDLKWKKISE